MKPFKNDAAKHKRCDNTHGVSYKKLYDKELKEIFESGVVNSSSKMSASKMREKSMNLNPARFSKTIVTEIK